MHKKVLHDAGRFHCHFRNDHSCCPPRVTHLPGPAAPEESPAPSLPETALPLDERLNSTLLLLHEPVGGFSGPLIWITGPDNATFNYTFYSRDYGPGNVTLTVSEVSAPLNTTPVIPSPGISARMIPDRFTAFPKTETISQLVVNISPTGYSSEPATRTFYVHAAVEGENNAIADDWIRVRMGDRRTTYLSYITTGDISGRDITIHRGGQWTGNITVRPGEREPNQPGLGKRTGLRDHVLLITGYPTTIQPQFAGLFHRSGPVHREELWRLRITGHNYRTCPRIQPGTYCYDLVINTPNESTGVSTTVQVIP